MLKTDLTQEPKLDRGPVTRGLYAAPISEPAGSEAAVDRNGGKFSAGIIRGISMVTRGEAIGHRQFIDADTLGQVASLTNASARYGIKSRFAHPDVSGDGIGKMTGKAFNARVVGDQVIADWHALKSAHETPDGDLAAYVMNLAEESPEHFGTSIAFEHDYEAEEQFKLDNTIEVESVDHRGQKVKRSIFKSPDSKNPQNYTHIRLKELRAVDVVDEPAANPNGLFHRNPFALLESGDAALSYVFGLTDDAPDLSTLGLDATRLRGFVQRFADSRGITFQKAEQMADVATDTTQATDTNAPNTPAAPATPAIVAPAEPKTEALSLKDVEAAANAAAAKAASDALAAERKRASDINALCQQAKHPELAAKFIEDGTSVSEAQGKLFTALCDAPPVGNVEKPEDPVVKANAKYISEYKAQPAYANDMTQDEYVAMRRVDDGIDTLKPSAKTKTAA